MGNIITGTLKVASLNPQGYLAVNSPHNYTIWGGPPKVEFQQKARRDGRLFERVVEDKLRRAGWAIKSTHTRYLGVEIDIIAAPPGGPDCLIECKGGNIVGRSGLARTDTVKKSIGTAWTLRERQYRQGKGKPLDYLLVTTMMPKKSTQGYVMLEEAARSRLFTHVGLPLDIVMWGNIFDSWYQRHYYYPSSGAVGP